MTEVTVTRDEAPTLSNAMAALRLRVRERAADSTIAGRVVYAATGAYAALFVFAAVMHFAVFRTAHPDLGNMVQAMWSTLHGHFLEMTTPKGVQMNRLGFHVDPFLVLLTPFYWVWSSPLLANNRLILVGSSGELVALNAKSGEVEKRMGLGAPALMAPISAGDTIYVATDTAQLIALR